MSVASQRVLEYLEGQPGIIFNRLYQQPSTALAIFRRMLPHLAKSLVMAMLYMPTPFPVADLDVWVKPDTESTRARDQSISILSRLRIFQTVRDEQGRQCYDLAKSFRKSLRLALTGGGNHRSFGVPSNTPDKNPVTIDYLDTYARQQWEAILYYIVGSADAGLRGDVDIANSTKQLLAEGKFVELRGNTARITQAGFGFLLQEINAQIWTLLIEYLRAAETLKMDPVDVLSFLFTLGSLELGVSYSTDNLTPTQQTMLDDLCDFGIIYKRPDSSRYYPTRLATTLTSDAPALPSSSLSSTTISKTATGENVTHAAEAEKGYIIVETNYRIYAYTSSPLLISILSLFANLKTRYPNMLTATLTKQSIQTAISAGITSDQIITYLTTHAHPQLRKTLPVLPPTVVDQIRLWQLEGERMKSTQGYLIRDMGTQDEYEKAALHADTLGILVWKDDRKGWIFVSRFEQMKQFFDTQKQRRREAAEAAGVGGVASGLSTPR